MSLPLNAFQRVRPRGAHAAPAAAKPQSGAKGQRPPQLRGSGAFDPAKVRVLDVFQSAPAIAGGRCASLPTPCQSCTFSCSRANVCSTIPLVKQTYASKEEKHRTTTTYEACEPVRRNAITPGSRRAR